MATYVGDNFPNEYYGSAQTQYGLDAADILSPRFDNKSYFLYGGNGNDRCIGYNFDDEIYGGRGDDYLQGYGGDDYIEGGSGADDIHGDYGNDYLSGGPGPDSFTFDSKLNASKNFDFIDDFASGPGGDLMLLSKGIFKGAGKAGDFLPASRFEVGSKATEPDTRIVYYKAKGVAFYDPDGSGSQSHTRFVKVSQGMDLGNTDFYLIQA
jgi:Ca2+-binding RTX toxin-like protein